MGVIFSVTYSGFQPRIPQNSDKIVHAVIYFLLAILFYFSFYKSGVKRYIFLLSFALSTIYGITDEFHQFYVPGREPSFGDIIANITGAFLGCYISNKLITKN